MRLLQLDVLGKRPSLGPGGILVLLEMVPKWGDPGFNPANIYFTKVGLVEGGTYSFVIEVNPATASYSASVTTGVGSGSASDLGFRNGAVNGAGDYFLFGRNTNSEGEEWGFSYDNVFVVPEPSAALLGLFGSLVLFRRRR